MDEFNTGLRVAIRETNAELRRPYEKAVLQQSSEYEDVVWSTADGDDLFRSLDSMFLSYQRIVSARDGQTEVDRSKYTKLVRKLRDSSHGSILSPIINRQGWYEYKEKMIRGYVRMQAEANGVVLSGEIVTPKQTMHIGNCRTGTYGSGIPKGVDQTIKKNLLDKSKTPV